MREFVQNSDVYLAGASGTANGRGLIGTVPAAATLYVRADTDRSVSKLDWAVSSNKAYTVQLYKARTMVESATLTLASLANNETLLINGLTYTAKDAGSTVASRYFDSGGADATADAAALTAVINNVLSGTIGITATSALGVVTIVPSTVNGAFILQAVTGTAAGHCGVANPTLLSLIRHGASVADATAAGNSVAGGTFFEQWIDGWPYAYLGITNNDSTNAATVTVKATRYWA